MCIHARARVGIPVGDALQVTVLAVAVAVAVTAPMKEFDEKLDLSEGRAAHCSVRGELAHCSSLQRKQSESDSERD